MSRPETRSQRASTRRGAPCEPRRGSRRDARDEPVDPRDAARWDAAEEIAELLREGDIDAAIAAGRRVAGTDPGNPYAWYWLGHAHFEAQRWKEALAAYVRALEVAPRHLGARIGAGHALRMMGEQERALRMANIVLAEHPDDPDALYLAGLVHASRGEAEAAIARFERFLATRPEAEVAFEVEGLIRILKGRIDAVLPMDPDEPR